LPDGITRIAWAPEGRQLAAATETGEIQLLAVE